MLVSHPYNISKFNKVNEYCSHCQLKFKIEPSFFYGSMYVSYGLGVGISIVIYLLQLFLELALGMIQIFFLITTILAFLTPYINALSKVIWANFFFRYDPNFKTNRSKNY
ncbi:DUF983 domain-containing protein [Flavobacteriaceae bacterium]|nr:DUF983 domain-containing protein [Flavobacteriaceae bacterium]MDB4612243.1 DUF983 domain-containing protein [Flavobacteriaceae bacterium]